MFLKVGDRLIERREVVPHGAGDQAVLGVEVPMGQPVGHAGDVGPRGAGRGVGELGGEGLDGLADLDEADADGVEDESVGQVAARDVAADGGDSLMDVGEAFEVPSAQRGIASPSAAARTRALRLLAGARSTSLLRIRRNSPSSACRANKPVPSGRSINRSTSLSGRPHHGPRCQTPAGCYAWIAALLPADPAPLISPRPGWPRGSAATPSPGGPRRPPARCRPGRRWTGHAATAGARWAALVGRPQAARSCGRS